MYEGSKFAQLLEPILSSNELLIVTGEDMANPLISLVSILDP